MVTAAACRARLSRQARSKPLSKRTLATTEAATLRQRRLQSPRRPSPPTRQRPRPKPPRQTGGFFLSSFVIFPRSWSAAPPPTLQ
jgi:hypothetical protein